METLHRDELPNITLIGIQGAGKGTQAALLRERLGYAAHISTGELLREEAEDPDSPDGSEISRIQAAGELVPQEILFRVFERKMNSLDGGKVILDGIPRSIEQKYALENLIDQMNATRQELVETGALSYPAKVEKPIAVNIEFPDEQAFERMLRRGRADDKPEAIHKRIATYHEKTEPILDVYESEGRLIRVDGVGTVEEVHARLADVLNGAKVR